jgi:hypothetical protein
LIILLGVLNFFILGIKLRNKIFGTKWIWKIHEIKK